MALLQSTKATHSESACDLLPAYFVNWGWILRSGWCLRWPEVSWTWLPRWRIIRLQTVTQHRSFIRILLVNRCHQVSPLYHRPLLRHLRSIRLLLHEWEDSLRRVLESCQSVRIPVQIKFIVRFLELLEVLVNVHLQLIRVRTVRRDECLLMVSNELSLVGPLCLSDVLLQPVNRVLGMGGCVNFSIQQPQVNLILLLLIDRLVFLAFPFLSHRVQITHHGLHIWRKLRILLLSVNRRAVKLRWSIASDCRPCFIQGKIWIGCTVFGCVPKELAFNFIYSFLLILFLNRGLEALFFVDELVHRFVNLFY